MTPLKPSEKRLLTAFGVAGFLLLNLLGFSWMKKRNLLLERQRISLDTRARELHMWKGRAGEAEQKRGFLDQHLIPYPDEAYRETYLDQFIQKEASDLNLDVRKNQPLAVLLEPHFHKSRYTAEVSGSWDDVLEFIYRLQRPKEFRFVSTLRLKSQKKEGSSDEAADVVCTINIEKWWSPQSALEVDPLPAATAPAAAAAAAAESGSVPTGDLPPPAADPVPPEATEPLKTAAAEQSAPSAVKNP